MGSFNVLCGVSGLTINPGDKCKAFVLAQETYGNYNTFKEPDDKIPEPYASWAVNAIENNINPLMSGDYGSFKIASFAIDCRYYDYGFAEEVETTDKEKLEGYSDFYGLDIRGLLFDSTYDTQPTTTIEHRYLQPHKMKLSKAYVREDVYNTLIGDELTRKIHSDYELDWVGKTESIIRNYYNYLQILKEKDLLPKKGKVFIDTPFGPYIKIGGKLINLDIDLPYDAMNVDLIFRAAHPMASYMSSYGYRFDHEQEFLGYSRMIGNMTTLGFWLKPSFYGNQYDNSKLVKTFYDLIEYTEDKK